MTHAACNATLPAAMLVLFQFLRRMRRSVQTRVGLRVFIVLIPFILASAIAFYILEQPYEEDGLTFSDSLWWAIVTMTTVGYGDFYPKGPAARYLVAIPTMLVGGGTLAYGLSFITTYLIEEKNKELRGMNSFSFTEHTVLINYPGEAKVMEMVDELRHDKQTADRDIVLLTDQVDELSDALARLHVHFVKGSPINEEALSRAGVPSASDAILFARNERDENSDSFNLGVLVALQSVNTRLRVIVECVSPLHKDLMLKAGATTAICVTELTTQLLEQARQGLQIQQLLSDLASNRTPQQVDAVPFEHREGKAVRFGDLAIELGREQILLLGVNRGGTQHVNPGLRSRCTTVTSCSSSRPNAPSGLPDRSSESAQELAAVAALRLGRQHSGQGLVRPVRSDSQGARSNPETVGDLGHAQPAKLVKLHDFSLPRGELLDSIANPLRCLGVELLFEPLLFGVERSVGCTEPFDLAAGFEGGVTTVASIRVPQVIERHVAGDGDVPAFNSFVGAPTAGGEALTRLVGSKKRLLDEVFDDRGVADHPTES